MNIRSEIIKKIGLLRSVAMYFWKPFNRRKLRRFYAAFIQSGDLCFDIGAHLGNRVDAWLKLGAKVVALEPQPLCIRYLERNFGHFKSLTLIPKAVGALPGKTEMHISWLAPTVSTLAKREWRAELNKRSNFTVNWDEVIEVEIITLDALIEIYGMPAFIKIDVEDYEAEVLKGLSHPVKALSFEFFNWTPERTRECLQLIDHLGDYEYNFSIGENQRFENSFWMDSEEILGSVQNLAPEKSYSGDIYARLATIR